MRVLRTGFRAGASERRHLSRQQRRALGRFFAFRAVTLRLPKLPRAGRRLVARLGAEKAVA